jgi:hypothetical protein
MSPSGQSWHFRFSGRRCTYDKRRNMPAEKGPARAAMLPHQSWTWPCWMLNDVNELERALGSAQPSLHLSGVI